MGGKTMNLAKLFEMQKELDDRILAEHPIQEGEDRLAKKILALLVELGELAQEWRGFKFWSKDQEPRTGGECCCDDGYFDIHMGNGVVEQGICPFCEGIGELPNTLLEEYVDCLHFLLSIGLESEIGTFTGDELMPIKMGTIEMQFITLFKATVTFLEDINYYLDIWELFLGLGEMLGFTWGQIEEAYMKSTFDGLSKDI